MIDKEKIKEEIERLDEEYRTLRVEGTTQQAKEADLVVHVLLQISNFIDSLPEESGCEDLEEYYKKEFLPKEWFAKPGQRTISQFNFFTARHFAEWQKQKSKQDFLEKAERFIEDTQIENFICRDDGIYFDNERFIEQFKNHMQDE